MLHVVTTGAYYPPVVTTWKILTTGASQLTAVSLCSGLRYKPQRCDLNLEEIFCGGWGRSDDSGIGLIGVKYVERLSRYGGGCARYMLLLGSLTNQEFEEL